MLQHPRKEFATIELAFGAAPGDAPLARSEAPLLDARALGELKRRVAELDDQLDNARALGNGERAARLEGERDAIAEEVSRSLGLGGRGRRAAGPAERARVAVTLGLRRAIAAVKKELPEVGEHLRRSIRTGAACSYDPDPSSRIRCTVG
jgi:hypothetical protein